MLDFKTIEKIARYLHLSTPTVIQDITYNLESKIKKTLLTYIQNMNFVNREEFDEKLQILLKIEKKLEDLEEKIKILEKNYHQKFNNLKKYDFSNNK